MTSSNKKSRNIEKQIFSLSALPWFDPYWQDLQDSIKNQSLPNGIIILGNQGIGKSVFTKALAQRILCQNVQEDKTCGTCSACQLFISGNHPDYREVKLQEKSNNIKIAQIAEVIQFTQTTSHHNGYRIVTIIQADKMNQSATNSLLKTLEEPGEKVLFLLTVSQLRLLAPTIRSRCQLIKITAPTWEQSQMFLAQAGYANDECPIPIYYQSSPLKTLEWLENSEKTKEFQAFNAAMEAFTLGLSDVCTTVDKISSKSVQEGLYWLDEWVVNCANELLYNITIGCTFRNELKSRLQCINVNCLFNFRQKIYDRIEWLLKGGQFNQQLCMEDLLLEWNKILSLK